VASPAERLPVRLVPKVIGIALVGNDEIHDRRCREPSHVLALGAERMRGEVTFPCGPPPRVIASARSRSAPLVALFALLNAYVSGSADEQNPPASGSPEIHKDGLARKDSSCLPLPMAERFHRLTNGCVSLVPSRLPAVVIGDTGRRLSWR
jgi:hypothetical protein